MSEYVIIIGMVFVTSSLSTEKKNVYTSVYTLHRATKLKHAFAEVW